MKAPSSAATRTRHVRRVLGFVSLCTALWVVALWVVACGSASDPDTKTPGSKTPGSAAVLPRATLDLDGSADEIERVVIVSIDTLRADYVGAYGDQDAETATLDELAAGGVRFDAAISPTPITLPSHTTLLTGLDPPEHGVRHNGMFELASEVETLAERTQTQGFASAAFVSAYVLDRRFGLDQGFDHYDDQLGVSLLGHAGPGVPTRPADRTVDAVLAWLEDAPQRFFLFVHLYDPHADHSPPQEYRDRFGEARLYDAEIAFADDQVGRLLSEIARRWPKGTLVVATSDHGESFGEHGEPTHSLTIYDATQRVPLIIAGPGVPEGRVVRDVVRLSDVTPTIVDLLALAPRPSSGASLRPLWEGTDTQPRVAWIETLATQFDFGWSPLLGVRTAAHKYIRAPRPELYALADDPLELENLAAEAPEEVARLDALVEERSGGRPIVPSTALDADERSQLEALGYVTEGPAIDREVLGVVGGADPKDEIHILGTLFEGMGLLARRRWNEAFDRFDAVGNLSYELSMLRGRAAVGAGRLAAARQSSEAAIAFAPDRGGPHILLGVIEEAAGDPDAARASYQRGLDAEPQQGGGWVGLGRVAEGAGDVEGAREAYRRALESRVFEAEAIWRLAALTIEQGDTSEARRILSDLPQAELRQPPAAVRLARAEERAGKGDLARIRIAGALRAFPGDVSLLLAHAELLERAGEAGGALRARRDAVASAPEDPDANIALARQLARGGRALAEARSRAEAAVDEAGRKPAALEALASVTLAEGRPAEALELVTEAEQDATGDVRTSLLLRRAEALADLGKAEDARGVLADAAEAAAGHPGLEADLARARARVQRSLRQGSNPASGAR